MFKEIALPFNFQSLGSPFFPLADDCLDSSFRDWKREHKMYMIGHDHCEVCVPHAFCIPVLNGMNNSISDKVIGELICSAFFARYRNEILLLARINPQRHIVRQSFAVGNLHERPW